MDKDEAPISVLCTSSVFSCFVFCMGMVRPGGGLIIPRAPAIRVFTEVVAAGLTVRASL